MSIASGRSLGAFWSLPGEHATIPLDRIADYPLLAESLEVWRRHAGDGLPATIDPLMFPRAAIRGLNLFEREPVSGDWRVRIVGSLVTDHVGEELRGTGLVENFSDADRAVVRQALDAAASRRSPDLLRRHWLDPRSVRWAYVRLYLPLSSDGEVVDRFATVIDPDSFGRAPETGEGPTGMDRGGR